MVLQIRPLAGKVQGAPVRNIGSTRANHQELMRFNERSQPTTTRTDHDSYIATESDRQELLLRCKVIPHAVSSRFGITVIVVQSLPLRFCREQDEDLEGLSAGLGHIGHMGLEIHEELSSQVHRVLLPDFINLFRLITSN